jgi:hypothetical protein
VQSYKFLDLFSCEISLYGIGAKLRLVFFPTSVISIVSSHGLSFASFENKKTEHTRSYLSFGCSIIFSEDPRHSVPFSRRVLFYSRTIVYSSIDIPNCQCFRLGIIRVYACEFCSIIQALTKCNYKIKGSLLRCGANSFKMKTAISTKMKLS